MQVYKITNNLNGKIYIGKDTTSNENYYGSGLLIKRAIEKYGIENFSKEILEECDGYELLSEREIYWIDYYNSTDLLIGYNISSGGDGGDTISNHPNRKKVVEKIRKTNIKAGKTYEEAFGVEKAKAYKEKLSKNRLGKTFEDLYGKERAKEIKAKISKTKKLNSKCKPKKVTKSKEQLHIEKILEYKNLVEKNDNYDYIKVDTYIWRNKYKTKQGYTFFIKYFTEETMQVHLSKKEKLKRKNISKRIEWYKHNYTHSEKTKEKISKSYAKRFLNDKYELLEYLYSKENTLNSYCEKKGIKSISKYYEKFKSGSFSYLVSSDELCTINNKYIRKKAFISKEKRKEINRKLGKRVVIDNKTYDSVSEASRILKIDTGTIRYRLKSEKYNNYSYEDNNNRGATKKPKRKF
jgi:group I intron endonuclease